MNKWKNNKFDNYSLFLYDLQKIKNQILGPTEFQENTKGEGRQESKVGSATGGSAELGTTSPSSI